MSIPENNEAAAAEAAGTVGPAIAAIAAENDTLRAKVQDLEAQVGRHLTALATKNAQAERGVALLRQLVQEEEVSLDTAVGIADAFGASMTFKYTHSIAVTYRCNAFEVDLDLDWEDIESKVDMALGDAEEFGNGEIEDWSQSVSFYGASVSVPVEIVYSAEVDVEVESDGPKGSDEWSEAVHEALQDEAPAYDFEVADWTVTTTEA